MPRFYFDTYDDDRAVPDGQGIVLCYGLFELEPVWS
jgi:hypothetical protein